MAFKRTTRIPMSYVEIEKEHTHPTAALMKGKYMAGRVRKGDTKAIQKAKSQGKRVAGQYGSTSVVRMKKDYDANHDGKIDDRDFKEGEVVARTQKIYPKQPNTTLVRAHTRKGSKFGAIRFIQVKQHTRTRK